VNVEVISEEAGVVQQHLAAEGDTVQVGQVIAIVGAGSGAPAATPAAPVEVAAPAAPAPVAAVAIEEEAGASDRTIASPAARKMAREKGIDLAAVSPVDPMGRVRVQDVEAHGTAPKAQPAATAPVAQA